MIRNTRSGEAVVFRIRLKNEDFARIIDFLGGHPSEDQIARWSQQTLVAALDKWRPVVDSPQSAGSQARGYRDFR